MAEAALNPTPLPSPARAPSSAALGRPRAGHQGRGSGFSVSLVFEACARPAGHLQEPDFRDQGMRMAGSSSTPGAAPGASWAKPGAESAEAATASPRRRMAFLSDPGAEQNVMAAYQTISIVYLGSWRCAPAASRSLTIWGAAPRSVAAPHHCGAAPATSAARISAVRRAAVGPELKKSLNGIGTARPSATAVSVGQSAVPVRAESSSPRVA